MMEKVKFARGEKYKQLVQRIYKDYPFGIAYMEVVELLYTAQIGRWNKADKYNYRGYGATNLCGTTRYDGTPDKLGILKQWFIKSNKLWFPKLEYKRWVESPHFKPFGNIKQVPAQFVDDVSCITCACEDNGMCNAHDCHGLYMWIPKRTMNSEVCMRLSKMRGQKDIQSSIKSKGPILSIEKKVNTELACKLMKEIDFKAMMTSIIEESDISYDLTKHDVVVRLTRAAKALGYVQKTDEEFIKSGMLKLKKGVFPDANEIAAMERKIQ